MDERRVKERTADLATIAERNAQVDAAFAAVDERAQTAQTDVNDRFAKAEASLVEAQVEILEAAAQQEKVVDGKFAEVESKRLEDAATATAAQDALKTEFQEQLAASDAKSAAAQAAVDEKFTQLETVRQGDLQDAEEKRRLASEAVEARSAPSTQSKPRRPQPPKSYPSGLPMSRRRCIS